MLPVIRIFVSSPSDVYPERIVAERVIKRLRDRYASDAIIEPVLWEHEPITAAKSFQDEIDKYINPADCDIVVLILWSKLGSPLKDEEGVEYPSGTVKEFWTSINHYKETGHPDILVYQKTSTYPNEKDTSEYYEERAAQKRAVEEFIKHMHTAEGFSKHAYHQFGEQRKFEETLEVHLEKMLERKLFGEVILNPSWNKGNPYQGLKAFTIDEAPVYFGRQVAIQRAFELLKERVESGISSLLILGASGSGKSSLASAGLAAKILNQWPELPFITMRPGLNASNRPAADLGRLLEQIPEFQDYNLPQLLENNPASLANIISKINKQSERNNENIKQQGPKLLLIIDQLEELLTHRIDRVQQSHFATAIEVLSRSGTALCVGTLRIDHLDRLAAIPEFGHFVESNGIYHLQPPTKAELGQMIRRPARAAGLYFEENRQTGQNLDDHILEETSGHAEVLPLLEYTLEQLYLNRTENGQLTLAAYNGIGGLAGSVSRQADKAYSELNIVEERNAALERVFRQLVTVSIEEAIPTRQRCPESHFDADPDGRKLIDAFVRERLLTRDQQNGITYIEIVHEALLNRWHKLTDWLLKESELLRMRSRLLESYQRWTNDKKRSDLLLPKGKALEEGEEVSKHPDLLPSEIRQHVNDYVDRSRQAVNRSRRYAILGVVAVGLFAIAASVASVVAVRRGNDLELTVYELGEKKNELEVTIDDLNAAERESEKRGAMARDATRETARELGHTNYLLSRIADEPEHDPIKSTHYLYTAALNYAKAEDWQEARMHLLAIERSRFGLEKTFPHNGAVSGSKLFDDGKRLLTWSRDGSARIWDVDHCQELKRFEHEGEDADVYGAELFSDDSRLLTWSADGTARIWDVEQGLELKRFKHEGKPYQGRAHLVWGAELFSNDSRLITWSTDNTARIWDVEQGHELERFNNVGWVEGAELFSGDSRLLTWSRDGTSRIWDVEEGRELKRFEHGDQYVRGAELFIGDSRLLTWSSDGTARIWDVEQGQELKRFEHGGEGARVYGVELFSNESRLLTWSQDGTARIWDVKEGQELTRFKHEGEDSDLDGAKLFSNDSRLLTWGDDGTARIWDVAQGHELKRFEHEGEDADVYGAELFSGDASLLTWSADGSARIWDVEQGQELKRFKHEGEDANVYGAELFSGDARLLTWSADGTARIWATEQSEEVRKFAHDDGVDGAELLSNYSCLLTWSDDGTARIWDVEQGHELRRFKHKPNSIRLEDNEYDDVEDAKLFSVDSRLLTLVRDGTTRIWDVELGQELKKFKDDGWVLGAKLFLDDSRLLTRGHGAARILDIVSGQELKQFKHEGKNHYGNSFKVFGAELFRNNLRLLTWSNDRTVRIWDVEQGLELKRYKHDESVLGAKLFLDDSRLLTWGSNGAVHTWDTEQGRELKLFKHDDWVGGAELFSNDSRVLTWGHDKTARIWDTEQGHEFKRFKHIAAVNGAELFSNDSRLLTWSQDGTARIWDVEQGNELKRFIHGGLVEGAVLFSGDSRLLTWGSNGAVRIWDTEQGRDLKQFKHDDWVGGAELFSEDSRLLTWSSDGTARIWDVDTKVPLERRFLEWQVRSATKIDEQTGNYRMMSDDEWETQRRKLFREYGGFLDTKVVSTTANRIMKWTPVFGPREPNP